MERARVFKTTGQVRIIANLTLMELIVFVSILMLGMRLIDLSAVPRLLVSSAIVFGAHFIYRTYQHYLPGASSKHLMVWFLQAQSYRPGKDTFSRPLVYQRPKVKAYQEPQDS